ncbi:hypothetical protein [Actinoplanes sp. URMC 104]|uniref:hypothetical protein n=1 Tax=Actinoplanes sp. URMC 104 TaxID=3423409 RepID=UPI003F1C60BE
MIVAAVFPEASIGTGVFALRPSEQLDADRLEKTLRTAGIWFVERNSHPEPLIRAAAVPGGGVHRVVLGYGFGGMPEKLWVIGPRALRHVLRLLEVDQPPQRLPGEDGDIPTLDQLAAEWDRFARLPVEAQVGASVPWLSLTGRANLEEVRSAPPLTFPVPAPPPGARRELGPRVRGWFWTQPLEAVGPTERRRVTADGVSATAHAVDEGQQVRLPPVGTPRRPAKRV